MILLLYYNVPSFNHALYISPEYGLQTSYIPLNEPFKTFTSVQLTGKKVKYCDTTERRTDNHARRMRPEILFSIFVSRCSLHSRQWKRGIMETESLSAPPHPHPQRKQLFSL